MRINERSLTSYFIVKRLIDISMSIIMIFFCMPLFVLVSVFVLVTMGKPVIFRQQRPGYRGRSFTLYKFRSMAQSLTVNGAPLPDKERLTPLGSFLRRTSFDELPELLNVVKGDMSLVGPRPLLLEYLARYSPEQARRHQVRPGITGWAQVNGRNAITWEDKFAFDVWYVDHPSVLLDIRIMCLTFVKVISRSGICQPGFATAEEFKP